MTLELIDFFGRTGVKHGFVGICMRRVHVRDGDIQSLKHRLWRSVRMRGAVQRSVVAGMRGEKVGYAPQLLCSMCLHVKL